LKKRLVPLLLELVDVFADLGLDELDD